MTSDNINPDTRQTFDPVRDCWYLTGATASGKTRVGIELAKLLNAEIISLDSMSVYREMNIGTAKPTAEQRSEVPHHLLDVVAPHEEYSLSQYVRDAHRVIGEIRSRGNKVLFVGGTPLYLKALLRGVYPGPPADWDFRHQIEEEVETVGIAALHARLEQVDPLAAAKLHPNDKRRIIRALEVYKQTGRPLSHEQIHFDDIPHEQCKAFVLSWPRRILHRRIESRVERMFQSGLVDEVTGLLDRYGELGRTAAQAVGYREVIEFLRDGQALGSTIEQVQARTRQFARRQETWFRNLAECEFISVNAELEPKEIAQQIAG
ncbi:MAG: tRNA (adenosine(37)-N6)-dimethylallyltransferase MiaA [Planctomycetaceae bacterium]|nr:tRNA (adenosine(37)-N6)-dimethylallyltransferase MiaA [Planctomycetaceae bacterium]MCB9941502.1 tRNA (adenosine(37)-N6)-dimethylallyltransferase MiaA [Planctomycetaceae bacterium]